MDGNAMRRRGGICLQMAEVDLVGVVYKDTDFKST